MATQAHVPVEECLRTSYDDRPTPDYLDGEIRDRGMPTPGHSIAQWNIGGLLHRLKGQHRIFGYSELHLRVTPTRYRVADLAVFLGSEPANASHEPPNIVIEILSPDDRMSHVIDKFDEYVAWGVGHIWLADPQAEATPRLRRPRPSARRLLGDSGPRGPARPGGYFLAAPA